MRASVNHGNGLFWISINHVQCHHIHTHTQSAPFKTRHKRKIYIKIIVKCNYNNRNGITAKMQHTKQRQQQQRSSANNRVLLKKYESMYKARDSLVIGKCIRFINRQTENVNESEDAYGAHWECVRAVAVSVSNVIFRRKDIELEKPQQLWQ